MARTPLARRLQETISAIGEARSRDVPVEQVVEERTTRRELLVRAGAVGAARTIPFADSHCRSGGGRLAGLCICVHAGAGNS